MESSDKPEQSKENKSTRTKSQARKINYIFYLAYQKYNENLCIFFSPFISLNNTPRRTSARYEDDGDGDECDERWKKKMTNINLLVGVFDFCFRFFTVELLTII